MTEPTVRRAPEPARKRALPTGFATLRDFGTFCIGMAIIVNEVFLSAKVETAAVAIGLALSGLPLVLNADERRRSPGSDSDPSVKGDAP